MKYFVEQLVLLLLVKLQGLFLQILEDLRNTWMQVIEQEDGIPQRSARTPDEVGR